MRFFYILKQGQIYLNAWPLEKKLGAIFPENRVIKATKFAQRFMPFFAVFAIVWQQIYGVGMLSLAVAIFTALFALCIPIQGLYWLGKRAQTPLPSQSAVWFKQIHEQLTQVNINLSLPDIHPTYQHLADILKKAQQKLDHHFWQEL